MIKINGKYTKWEENLTVDLLLKKYKYSFPLLMIMINGKYISNKKYNDTLITDNDDIQIIQTMAGG